MKTTLRYTVDEDVVNASTGDTAWFVRGHGINCRFARRTDASLFAWWMNMLIWGDLGPAP